MRTASKGVHDGWRPRERGGRPRRTERLSWHSGQPRDGAPHQSSPRCAVQVIQPAAAVCSLFREVAFPGGPGTSAAWVGQKEQRWLDGTVPMGQRIRQSGQCEHRDMASMGTRDGGGRCPGLVLWPQRRHCMWGKSPLTAKVSLQSRQRRTVGQAMCSPGYCSGVGGGMRRPIRAWGGSTDRPQRCSSGHRPRRSRAVRGKAGRGGGGSVAARGARLAVVGPGPVGVGGRGGGGGGGEACPNGAAAT